MEPLLEAGKRVGVVDPTGAWWGLRSSRDGKEPGFPILVLGGDHGDLPLPALGGAAVARLLVEQGVNLVADTSKLTTGERTRWMIEFAGTLFRLNRAPLHLVIDEAHYFAPKGKIPDPDVGRMLHEVNSLASGGRSRGVRLTVITQRPQKLHNDTLTCADTLIAMRLIAPADRAAAREWVEGCGDLAQGKEVLNSLAGLSRGEGWVWYPEGDYLKRLKFPEIKTFDSSATPDEKHAAKAPKRTADIDMTEIKAALADAVKEAEQNDPKILRKKIADLERDLKKSRELAVDTDALERARDDGFAEGNAHGYKRALTTAADAITRLGADLPPSATRPVKTVSQIARKAGAERTLNHQATAQIERVAAVPATDNQLMIGKPMPRAILTALVQHPRGLSKGQILVHADYRSSGSVSTCFAELVRNGHIENLGGTLYITEAGKIALGAWDPLPTGADLQAHILNGSRLSIAEKKIMGVLLKAYPEARAKGAILEACGYASSGSMSTAFAHLVALGYARQAGTGALVAGSDFFE